MQKFKDVIHMTMFAILIMGILLLHGCKGKTDGTNMTDSTGATMGPTADPTAASVSYVELNVGDTAPDFDVELLNGDTVKLSDYQGKVVLLNFWATWCPPCVKEMPDIQKISDTFSEEAVVLGVNYSETRDKVSKFIEGEGYTYPIGLDENWEIAEKYPTDGIPYTVIIDGEGIITSIHLGGGSGMFTVFEEDLKTALGNRQ